MLQSKILKIKVSPLIFCPTWRYSISFANKRLLFTLYCIFDAPQHASFNWKLPTRDILAFYPPQFGEKKWKMRQLKEKTVYFIQKMMLTYDPPCILIMHYIQCIVWVIQLSTPHEFIYNFIPLPKIGLCIMQQQLLSRDGQLWIHPMLF